MNKAIELWMNRDIDAWELSLLISHRRNIELSEACNIVEELINNMYNELEKESNMYDQLLGE